MSGKEENVATVTGDGSQALMYRIHVVAGHDLKQPLSVAILSIGRVVDEGGSAAAACRLNIALDALKRLSGELSDIARERSALLRIPDGIFVPAERSGLNRGIA